MILQAQIVPCQNSLLPTPALLPRLIPPRHHNPHFSSPPGPDITVLIQRESLDIVCRLSCDFRPHFQHVARRRDFDVTPDKFTQSPFRLGQNCMPEEANIDRRVADAVNGCISASGRELQICARGLEEIWREHGVLVVVAVERNPEESRLSE